MWSIFPEAASWGQGEWEGEWHTMQGSKGERRGEIHGGEGEGGTGHTSHYCHV